MKMLFKIANLIACVMIIATSVLQYHHHNHDGKFSVFSISENDYSVCYMCEHSASYKNHHHNNCCNKHHSEHEENCSMQLSSVSNIKKTEPSKTNITQIFISVICIFQYPNIFDTEEKPSFNCKFYPIPLTELNATSGLRAPPIYA